MPWSEEHLAIVRANAELGLTASQIGAKVGYSRNAIVSIIKRRGFVWNYKSADAQKLRIDQRGRPKNNRVPPGLMDARLQERITRKVVTTLRPPQVRENPKKHLSENPEYIIDDPPEAKPGDVRLTELRWHHCKWPIGDPTTPEFRWCGLKRIDGKPYCKKHNRIASIPWTRRRP